MDISYLVVHIIIPIVALMNTYIIVMMAIAGFVVMTIQLIIAYDYDYCSQYHDHFYISSMTVLITVVVLNNILIMGCVAFVIIMSFSLCSYSHYHYHLHS